MYHHPLYSNLDAQFGGNIVLTLTCTFESAERQLCQTSIVLFLNFVSPAVSIKRNGRGIHIFFFGCYKTTNTTGPIVGMGNPPDTFSNPFNNDNNIPLLETRGLLWQYDIVHSSIHDVSSFTEMHAPKSISIFRKVSFNFNNQHQLYTSDKNDRLIINSHNAIETVLSISELESKALIQSTVSQFLGHHSSHPSNIGH